MLSIAIGYLPPLRRRPSLGLDDVHQTYGVRLGDPGDRVPLETNDDKQWKSVKRDRPLHSSSSPVN